MNTQEGNVVAVVTISTNRIDDEGTWVARIKELGITAYGRGKSEATMTAKEMFAESVSVHREIGNLSEWLNRFSIDWTWEEHYAGPLEVEDVSVEASQKEFGLVA